MKLPGVLGPIDSSELGCTLVHEHVNGACWNMRMSFPEWHSAEKFVERATVYMKALKAEGVDTVIDFTPINIGRDIKSIIRVAEATGMQMMSVIGFYYGDDAWMHGATEDIFYGIFMHDIEKGMEGTGIKPCIIKVATDAHGISPINRMILRAGARASIASGLPIYTHASHYNGMGKAQQDVFEEMGVDLSHVCIGHCGDTSDVDYIEDILKRGSYVGLDRFSFDNINPLENRVRTACELVKRGYTDRLFLSHDRVVWPVSDFYENLPDYDPDTETLDMRYLNRVAIPELMKNGITGEQIHTMLYKNVPAFFENSMG